MIEKIINIFRHKDVRERIIFTLGILLVFKWGTTITVPLVDLSSLSNNLNDNGILSLMNILGGGALKNFSLFALGVSPYITATIIIQLLSSGVLPKLEELTQQGEHGRRKLENATRYLTLMLAAIQAYGITVTVQNSGLIENLSFTFWEYMYITLVLVAGSMFIMWLADQISEKGIGNGISIIIFAGIISTLPYQFYQAYLSFLSDTGTSNDLFTGILNFVGYTFVYVIIVFAIVFIDRGVRKIPIQYSASSYQANSEKDVSYLPIKANSAGVIPVIFSSAILIAPITIISFIDASPDTGSFADTLTKILSLNETYKGVPWGLIIYSLLIFSFTFFYAFMQIDPKKISDNFSKAGTYIPGIRPGEETRKYVSKILGRVTLIGATFLTLICAMPLLLTIYTDMPSSLAFGGTGLLIVVGVSLETTLQIEGRITQNKYKGNHF